jgi:hypothetical protein
VPEDIRKAESRDDDGDPERRGILPLHPLKPDAGENEDDDGGDEIAEVEDGEATELEAGPQGAVLGRRFFDFGTFGFQRRLQGVILHVRRLSRRARLWPSLVAGCNCEAADPP